MAKNEAKIRFTAETGELNSEIKKSNDSMSKLRAELKLNETQMKATGATVEGLEEKHRILADQLSASENKTQALSQKVDKAAQIFGENSAEVTKLRTQLVNAQTAEEKVRQALAACNDELEAQRSAAKQSETASEQLANTISNQQEELNRLKKEYADAVLEYGRNSKEAKALANQIDSLSNDLKENQSVMSRAEKAADDLDKSLDKAGDSAKDASEGFTVLKGAMADLVADGIEKVATGLAEIGTDAFGMAMDVDTATDTFIAKTGESVESAGEFEDMMESIYRNNFGENFEDIADAMATVRTNIGDMDDGTLQKMTEDALLLRDTFDFDVNETTRAAKSLMDQFGISGTDAYNLIAQGAQSGLNRNGDLLDVINEYSVQFKDAGYGAEEMFNMLANGTKTGTWSVDKLGDAVKEFNIRASDGTVGDSIKENAKAFGMTATEAKNLASQVENGSVGAYQKLADKLRAVDDDTERYKLGVSMFGTMWEDLGEETVLSLLNTQGQIKTTSDALNQINDLKYDNLGSAIEGIKRNLQTNLADPIKNNVMPAVNEFIEDVDWQGVGQTVGQAFGTVVEGALAFVDAIKQSVQWMNEHKGVVIAVASVIGVLATAITAYNVVQGIKTAMDAANVTTVWGLVAAHIAQAAAAMAAIAPYVLIVAAIAAVIAIIVLCIKHWDDIVAAVKNCWDACCATLSGWGDWINTNVIQPIVNFFKNLWDDIVSIFKSLMNWVKTNWKSILLFIINPFAGAFSYLYQNFEGFRNFVNKIVSSVKQFFANLWSGIKNAASSCWSGIVGIWSSVASWFSTKIIQPVKNFFSGMWSGIKNAGSNAWSGLKNIWSGVSNFFSGIVNKVKSVFSKVKNFILSPFRNAINAVKNLFSKLKLSFPNIKLPHFSVKPKGWKIGDLLEGSIPKLGIEWYKEGGIFTKPTIFGTPYGFKGVGEAGAEAVLPIDKLEGYISGAIEKAQNVVNLQSLANAIEDLATRPVQMNINGRQFALATAGDSDGVNGLRSSFKGRGLALD